MPSPPLSNLAAHYDYFCVHEAAKVMLSSLRPLGYTTLPALLSRAGAAHGPGRPSTTTGVGPAAYLGLGALLHWRVQGQEVLLRSPSQPQKAVVFSACLRLGLHKLAFAVASLCVDPAVVRSHAVWVYTDTSALETYEHTSYTLPHIVNRSMWMGRHQERHTAIFVPLGEETGLASCPVWWGKVYVAWIISLLLPGKHILLSDHDAAPTALCEVADLQQLCVTESDFRLAAGEFPSDTIWDFAPAATRTPTPRHAVSVGTIFMSEPSTDAQGGLTVFCRIPGVAYADFGVVPWMWRSDLPNYGTMWRPVPMLWMAALTTGPESPWDFRSLSSLLGGGGCCLCAG